MPTPTITCPKCHESFPISAAVQDDLVAPLRKQFEEQLTRERHNLREREVALQEKEAALAAAGEHIEEEVAKRVAEHTATLEETLRKDARESVAVELRDLQGQVEEKNQKIADLQETELKLRKRERELEEDKKAMELEVARKVDAERKQIEEAVTARVTEAYQLKEKEYAKKMEDLRDQLSEAKRKAEQGSEQMQGEVLELELEQLLKTSFPHDGIEPVPKGVAGGDVLQSVYTPAGHHCGVIMWESKRTKNWSDGWIGKLKDDQRAAKADIAVLVTQVLPKGVTNFAPHDGVWVTTYACALRLATALRQGLMQLTHLKIASASKDEKMEVVFNFLTGPQFRNRVQAIVETFIAMKADLDQEKRVYIKRWAQREQQLERMIGNTAGMYGDLQGLIGASMQSIPALEAGEEAEETEAAPVASEV
jgi:hypothetical protein